MKKIGKFSPFLIALLLPLFVQAADVHFDGMVNRNEITKDDSITLTLSLSSDSNLNEDEEPRLPSLDGFELLNKWTQSESQSIFENGQFKFVRKVLYRYTLAPQKTGNLVIGAAEIKANGQALKTKPIKIKVVSGGSQLPPPKAQAQDEDQGTNPFGSQDQDDDNDLFSQLLRRQNQRNQQPPPNSRDAFFIGVDLNKKKAYVGEEILATWYLYVKGNIQSYDALKYPDLKGFWKEDLEMATRLNFQPEVVNGNPYQRALLVSYALFPISAGTKMIDDYKAKATVIQMDSPMAIFGMGTPMSLVRASKEIPIEVVPLPVEGKPASFSGAVGHFNITGSLGATEGKVNQPISLKIRFSGEGNVKAIDLPPIDLPKGLELYDTKKDSKFQKNGLGYKEFELLIIPRAAGEVTIPAIAVSYFDPKLKKYVSSQTPAFPLKVLPADPGATNNFSSPLAQTPAPSPEKTEDIRYLKTISTFALPPAIEKPLWLLLFLCLYGGFGWVIWGVVSGQAGGRTAELKKKIRRKLESARAKLQVKDFRGVGVESSNAVVSTLGEVTGVSSGSIPIEQTLGYLPKKSAALQERTQKFLNRCEVISFAPSELAEKLGQDDRELKQLIGEAESIISDLFQLEKSEKSDVSGASSSEDQKTS